MTEGCPPDVISFATPTARQSHVCCECHRTIQPGEQYQRVSGIWEGKAYKFKTCLECVELGQQFRRYIEYDYLPAFGYLRECIQNEGLTEEEVCRKP